MDGILLLVGLVLGVVCLIAGKLLDPGGSTAKATDGIDDGRLTDSVYMLPVGIGSFDMVETTFGLEDDLWSIDRQYEQGGPFEDLASGVRAAGWSSESTSIDEPNHAVADDIPVHRICINPATGLPMVSDSEAGFDVGGNPYGFSNDDLSGHHDNLGFGFDSLSSSHGYFGGDD